MTHWKTRYFTLWSGQALSLVGSQVVQFALIWWLARKTDSATVLTLASLAGLVPAVALSPVIGALVDRWDRCITMITADLVTALLTLGLVFLFASDRVGNRLIYVVLFFRSIAGIFHSVSMQSSTSLLVPREQLVRVSGLRQALDAGMGIGAPFLGALLVSVLSMEKILLMDAVTCLFAVLPLFFIPIPNHRQEDKSLPTVWLGMREGFSFILGWRGLATLCAFAAAVNLFVGSISILLPIMVTRHYGSEVGALATFESLFCVGMVAGGLAMSIWGGFKKRILTLLVGILALGFAIIAFGLSPGLPFFLACVSVGLAGFMVVFSNTPITALLQVAVPVDMQGRVFATLGSLCAVSVPLGLTITGPLSDMVDVSHVYIVIGIVCSILGGAAFGLRGVWTLEEHRLTVLPTFPEAREYCRDAKSS
ncbi:MAG TPA: MFS transporter [Fibrobacteria bacterium]|nr:MFS transporter [Fibrobacteria bacterium]